MKVPAKVEIADILKRMKKLEKSMRESLELASEAFAENKMATVETVKSLDAQIARLRVDVAEFKNLLMDKKRNENDHPHLAAEPSSSES
jgi:hypothetical protein